MTSLARSCTAECFGTFALVFAGTGAITVNEVTGGAVGHAGIAMVFGLIVLAMILALGPVSGAHMNPAVSLGLLLARRFPAQRVGPYVLSQTIGGLAASGALKLLFPTSATLGATLPAGSNEQSFVLEFILTFFLMLVILGASGHRSATLASIAAAVGATVLLEAMFAGPISGASMNPVRSLAPAVLSGNLSSLWVYIIAPISGAAIAVFLYARFLKEDASDQAASA